MSDRLSCQFYTRIGACRHGEKCSRKHIKPTRSKTVLLPNLYQNPKLNKNDQDLNPKQITEFFENFYKDIFIKACTIDEVISLIVCENENNHLNGNVYIKFKTFDGAIKAIHELNNEWFGSRPVYCELSPVDNFPDANCKAYDTNSCTRGDHCNFMHLIRPNNDLKTQLHKSQEKTMLLAKIQQLKDLQRQKQQLPPSDVSSKDFQTTVENLFKPGV